MTQGEEGFFDFLLGYRKTLAWVAMFTVSLVLLLKAYITGAQWVDVAKATFLGFISGNMAEHLGNLGQSYFGSKVANAVSNVAKKEEG